MKQIDNFLDKNDFKDLKGILTSTKFPWYINHGVSYAGDDSGILFTHTVYKNDTFNSSFTLGGLDIFKKKLQIVSLVRAKFNLLHRTESIIKHLPHIDIPNPPDNLKTAILYFIRDNIEKHPNFIKNNMADICASIQERIISILLNPFASVS